MDEVKRDPVEDLKAAVGNVVKEVAAKTGTPMGPEIAFPPGLALVDILKIMATVLEAFLKFVDPGTDLAKYLQMALAALKAIINLLE